MELYRFSPIQTQEEFKEALKHIHFESYKLCKESFGEYLSNAGNIAIFCHYPEEYERLLEIQIELCEMSENWNQKYFKFKEPLVMKAVGDVPETIYQYLYIRKPDPYRHHVGDLDFYLSEEEYRQSKKLLENGVEMPGARVFPGPHLDMLELYHPDSDVLAYVSTAKMADLARTTKSGV